MKKLTSVLFLIAALFGAVTVKAQQMDTVKSHNSFMHGHEFAGAVQIQVTYRKADISQLNQILNINGIPSISPNNIWINASMAHISHNWITEDGIGLTPVATSSANNIFVKYNQYQIYFKAGYNLTPNADFRLYPFAGLNLSAAILDVQDRARSNSVSSFSNELLNSTSGKTFYQPNFGIELGAGFDYVIKLKSKQMDCFTVERNIPIGVRAGYYINTYAGDWKLSDNYTPEGNNPNQKQSAVFVTFNIGLGYKVRK